MVSRVRKQNAIKRKVAVKCRQTNKPLAERINWEPSPKKTRSKHWKPMVSSPVRRSPRIIEREELGSEGQSEQDSEDSGHDSEQSDNSEGYGSYRPMCVPRHDEVVPVKPALKNLPWLRKYPKESFTSYCGFVEESGSSVKSKAEKTEKVEKTVIPIKGFYSALEMESFFSEYDTDDNESNSPRKAIESNSPRRVSCLSPSLNSLGSPRRAIRWSENLEW